MTFDEQHGWVERGTRGVHSGAVVRDLTTEMHTLHKMHLRAAQDGYWWPEMPRAMRAERLEELIRHHENMSEMLRAALRQSPVKRTAEEYITHKLALLAPYIAILRAGDEKRRRRVYAGFDVGQGQRDGSDDDVRRRRRHAAHRPHLGARGARADSERDDDDRR